MEPIGITTSVRVLVLVSVVSATVVLSIDNSYNTTGPAKIYTLIIWMTNEKPRTGYWRNSLKGRNDREYISSTNQKLSNE